MAAIMAAQTNPDSSLSDLSFEEAAGPGFADT